ncbi:MAG: relaxase/mobilization nuclease domain-containing protein, partial [Chloroflexi bacterium]|nr:relaxase/mobilization nuclease domain-containing protein [Chloroflexota bacterium]
MIAKKIENPKKSAGKRERITALLEYIWAPDRDDTTEKCTHAGAVNFLTNDTTGRIGEMLAVALQATRSRDPVEHYVCSWQKGEHPSPDQVDELIATLRREMSRQGRARDRAAAERLLIAYALHEDTKNDHAHVVVLRVDPATGRPVEINRGFDRDLIQRVAARVEHAQGWAVEKNKRFKVGRDGNVVPVRPNPKAPDRPAPRQGRKPSQRVRDRAHRAGTPSVTEHAIEKLGPIFERAGPWNAPGGLYEQLAAAGAEYRLKGGGAVVEFEGVTMKASDISRQASPRALEKQYGQPYEPPRRPVLTPELQAIAATPPPGDGPPLV